ncbi:MAG TPA: caspase family protein [Acidobacteriaceae bacterium]|nr:caspase family protein [Acidobacteriaceae bacterium]
MHQRISRGAVMAAAAIVLCAGAALRAQAQSGRCGAGVDLVVQALEKMRASSSNDDLLDADELLKRAAELCSDLGDAWYYRSLVERKLGNARLADFAMRQAKLFPSDASADQLNPFVLSTPMPGTRGVTGNGATPATPAGPPGQRWALIVGIGTFTDQNIEPLKYTASDAQSFESALLDPKVGGFKADHVHSLMNDQATTKNIKMQLNWLARSAGPDDVVVVYVATHGSSRDLDTVGVNYIITHDTEIGANIDPDSLYATALPMVDISNAIATRVKAQRAAIFLDTCYSGNAAVQETKLIAPGIKNASLSPEAIAHITQGSGRMVFAAAGTDQESLESDQLKHGFFTYYLVQALQQEGAKTPLTKIFDYTQQHVAQTVATEFRQYNMQQTPVMGRSEDSTDFSLAGS